MNDIAQEGRTVLFVSHNMSAIQNLCKSVMHLSKGKLVKQGKTGTVIQHYLNAFEDEGQSYILDKLPRRNGLGELIRISRCSLVDTHGKDVSKFLFGAPFSVYIRANSIVTLNKLSFVVQIDSFQRETIVTSSSELSVTTLNTYRDREIGVLAKFRDLRLMPGRYWITISVRQGKMGLDQVRHAIGFEISEASFPGIDSHPATWGHVQALPEWIVE